MEDGLYYGNGVDARTGDYCVEPVTEAELVDLARAATKPEAESAEGLLQARLDREKAHYGLEFGIDPCDLAQTGWGVVFPAAEPGTAAATRQEAIREALQPLLRHRQAQASSNDPRFYQEYTGARGYRRGDGCAQHLARLGVDPSVAANPEAMPYYLLLAGSPEEIPFVYQYLLDVTYAVGRIDFDTIDEYHSYAKSVVEAETGPRRRARRAAFFGVQNEEDEATKLSRAQLVEPLASQLELEHPRTWSIERHYDAQASKATLGRLLGGEETPALLFSASHGASFPCDDPMQLRRQGALLCSEWRRSPGEPLKEDVYFSADDLSPSADLRGLIAFNFACYGAGTPEFSDYRRRGSLDAHPRVAPRPFLSSLHKALLGHPRGGALATVGHIDLAFAHSLPSEEIRNRIVTFRGMLKALMRGIPVGAAMESFNQRFAALGAGMSTAFDTLTYLQPESPEALREKKGIAKRWVEHNDARGYVVTGDPAVRLVWPDPGAAA